MLWNAEQMQVAVLMQKNKYVLSKLDTKFVCNSDNKRRAYILKLHLLIKKYLKGPGSPTQIRSPKGDKNMLENVLLSRF